MSATNTDTPNHKAESPAAVAAASKGDLGGIDFRQTVDGMPINVLTCDLEDFKINYANAASVATLKELEHVLPCSASGGRH